MGTLIILFQKPNPLILDQIKKETKNIGNGNKD